MGTARAVSEVHPSGGIVSLFEEKRRRALTEKGLWFELPFSEIQSMLFNGDSIRIDAESYSGGVLSAKRVMSAKALHSRPLGGKDGIADVFILGRFKRAYTSDATHGTPYLSASEAFMFRPRKERWLATSRLPSHPELHYARANWILISTSGSVGRPLLVTKRLEPFFLTHDLARIRLKDEEDTLPGYVYAFLASSLASVVLRQSKFGETVRHLEPSHISPLRVPSISRNRQEAIHQEVIRAYRLRDEANDSIDEALDELHEGLGIAPFDPAKATYLSHSTPRHIGEWEYPSPSAFKTKSNDLNSGFIAEGHNPMLRLVTSTLGKGHYPPVPLGREDRVKSIFVAPRFRRVYVASEHGVPFLQGSDLPVVRPFLLKHLSKKTPGLSKWMVSKGWVLITCSGTIGEVGMVSSMEDGWAASQHILRIVPLKEGRGFHPGYIAAFLLTEYGRQQLIPYGAVVLELTADTVKALKIPDAPSALQEKVGSKIMDAFEKRALALKVEDEAIQTTEELIRNIATKD
jgi:type I restriction enzyme S subunit